MYYSTSISKDGSGRIYISYYNNRCIIRTDDISGTNWTSFGSFGSKINQFDEPRGIYITSDSGIFVY